MIAVTGHAVRLSQGAMKGWHPGLLWQGHTLGGNQTNLSDTVTACAFYRRCTLKRDVTRKAIGLQGRVGWG